MTIDHDSNPSPRLDRLLRADASGVPAGLVDRVFAASVVQLPARRPAVIARLSWRWVAAAAALLLACGVALRVGMGASLDEGAGHATIAVVIEASDESSLGEDMRAIDSVRGVRLADIADEMNYLLADGRVDG